MEAEQTEILNFISQYPPFDLLPEEQLNEIAIEIEVAYHRADSMILNLGDSINDLFLIRSGAVEVYRRKGELYNRLDEGDIFGQMGLLMNNRVRMPAKALEDTLLYCIPGTLFTKLCDDYDSFADFVEVDDGSRLRHAVSRQNDENDLTTSKVRTLLTRDAVILDQNATIQVAAQTMADEGISALLICDVFRSLNSSHELDHNEIAITIKKNRELKNIIIDKAFVNDSGVAHVIDWESSKKPTDQNDETYIDSQKAKHKLTLDLYSKAYQELSGANQATQLVYFTKSKQLEQCG